MLDILDTVYNWLVDFFSGRRHCTRYKGSTSTMLDITTSIIQGSAVGPVSYVINAADLNTLISSNYTYYINMLMIHISSYRPVTPNQELLNSITLLSGHT